ncbi:hypothetical protein GJW-30_1_00579 [Variibacter gotjawalensis]|uniref:Uncharacterized protein n=1 Tax=Variibacter gotjawalensis TaxID=1333996 RepID=A0A0S3PQ06_9BRAD|nr:hypothetical protein [Variibacter gotjawalensis]NIK48365.1 hypothetical protein [Variibacter gotjawalensis]BAT58065.1 hypothetical protein GJW-30_1_00579 [Variibacter gotjawalensis]
MTHIIDSVSLISSIGAAGFEHAQRQFDEIDAKSYDRHYVVVEDADLDLFKPFHRDRRVVLPLSVFLPEWLSATPVLR